ncbi:MAG: DUF5069 domain-containing protein [Rubritalea sp.]
MNKTIPLISSGLTGPLGVLHLPRLWQKVSLEIAGKLNSDYPGIGGGYDSMVLDGLSLNKDAFVAFMQTKPTYNQLEAWVLEQSGGAIDAAAVSTLNDAITGYNHDDETRKEILSACGIADDSTILDAVNLNNLDDWQCFHAQEIA